ncbi:hypothetical protein AB0I72_15250 [Nocardiopsis sp. NPDC049922]|uniref:hypothetical protein n=1 Tax=Nocardiopsis sp. NPDC049922 TaxID=3155157 RepID=UPI0033DC868C
MNDIRQRGGPGVNFQATWRTDRTVLAVVHHLTAATRLADVLPLFESDPRVQVVFTVPPFSRAARSGAAYVDRLGAAVLDWEQATSRRFDLAVAASLGGLEQLDAPVLTIEHGSGPGKLRARHSGEGPEAPREIIGSSLSGLVFQGRIVPAMIGIPHHRQRSVLARHVPQAVEVAHVVGDPTFDRVLASLPERDTYRRALGVSEGQTLVFVSSTWWSHSLLGRMPDLPGRLAAELAPHGVRVVTAVHPGVHAVHGHRQVRAWMGDAVGLLPPEGGWQAAIAACDVVVGDHGSVTYYAAAAGRPVLLAQFPHEDVVPASHTDLLGRAVPRLDAERPFLPQVRACAREHVPERAEWFTSMLTSAPGDAARLLREAVYRLMGLPEPDRPAVALPVPPPVLSPSLLGQEQRW